MRLKHFVLPMLAAVAMAVIALFFHYPVHIENALTLQPEAGFGIQTNLWRTIFEPVLGVLLYFNRSFYGITEILQTLFWLLLIYAGYTLVKSFLLKENNRKKFLVGQLVNLPVLAGIWFALFVVMIFIPLPNDKIVKKTSDWVLVTTHSHTEFSHDGLISQEGLLKWHKRNGFDAFFITDHNNHRQTLEFVNQRWNKVLPGEPVVFCGEEFSGSNHLSLLGLKSDFKTKGLPDSVVVAKARSEGAAILVNHWFDGEHKTLDYYHNLGVDGFEIENTATDKRYNREVYQRIKTFCEENGLIMNGGLDFHGYGSACTLWNAFEIPGWKNMDSQAKEEAILNIIKTRDQSKLKVLLLNDRPYYEKKNLFLHTLFTLFTYFRTLNIWQVLSWIFWMFVVAVVTGKLNRNPETANKYSCQQIIPLAGIAGALFLLSLGLVYLFRNQNVEDFTEIYPEYYRLLFMSGFVLLIISCVTAFFRTFRK